MPLYAYKCQDCGAQAEYIQKFSDPPMTVCEECGGHIEKQLAAAAFHLKGGGWYKDGYASSKPGASKGEGSSGASSDSSGSAGSGDGKATKASKATKPAKPETSKKKSA